ncbi:thiamine-monophosphate kinase [Aquimarina sp. RZ0]|uniref:thiamine-phosphate kinase n=1 Tax=Aquimarina sp. RZ0 TaxID=2607730 RepID=UPI0011F1FEED|nr:thiamine-phosphate kinase [Aquimarina sp. RZ0]KAA1243616.1 thiamine-monophosphate kinase [Aquimarina sp. RZ0]
MTQQDELIWHEKLTSLFPRHPSQLNKVNEADAEIVFLEQNRSILAITTDIICEEIQTGIYKDPFLMGWMSVVVNISDLCAVGAIPKFLTLNEVFQKDTEEAFITKVQEGIAAACSAFNVSVLGGDTNFADQILLGGTAIGFIPSPDKIVQRKGAQIGDLIYTGSSIGSGNFFAFAALQNLGTAIEYRPYPNIKLSQLMASYANSCIDTSDGLFHALYTLMKVNTIGFSLNENAFSCIPKQLLKHCNRLEISPITLFAGIVGEYELIYTIPQDKNTSFLKEVENHNINVHCIGKVTDANGHLSIISEGQEQPIDLEAIVQAFTISKGDIKAYIHNLKKQLEFQ